MVPTVMRHLPLAFVSASLFVLACGRPASEKECNEIVTRTATLEYQGAGKTAAPVDSAQIETIRARVKESMLKNCVGKRITDKALRCMREAKTAKEIEERCFD
jgi:small lipoprotein (TIGR04454 family)